jgi:beta-mannosidase
VELSGTWRAAPADHDLRLAAVEPDFDDGAWEPVTVPGHWRCTPAFADADGPLLHRRVFDAEPPADHRRRWLVFDGVFYQGDVWLDGAYLGDTEGYFQPHTFEITDPLRERTEHVVAVEVSCAPQRDKRAKRNLTGVWQHWDCLDDTWNPGGIWRPVRIDETGPVRIRDLRVLCREATPERAVVVLRANLDAVAPMPVVVRSSVGDADHELTQPLAAGENHVEWTVTVEQPELWWPWSLGDQAMHDVVVEVAPEDRPSEVSHRRTCRTGLRRIELRDWVCRVNGERLFLRARTRAPPGRPSRRRPPRTWRATSPWPRRQASTCCDCTRTSLDRSCTTPPTRRGCCCGRTSRSSGATPAASASRRCARPRPPCACSVTTRRSPSGAVTTSPSPSPTPTSATTRWSSPAPRAGSS